MTSVDHTVKDAALVAVNGEWFSAFSAVDTAGRWRVGIEHSADLSTWSRLAFMPHDAAVEGEASPDVVRAPDGRLVITYQSFVHDAKGGLAKLYYRTTADFVHFSAPHPLLQPHLDRPSDRLIDPALAWTPAGLMLGYKTGGRDSPQAFEIARSKTGSLDGPWQLVGKPGIRVFGDTIENYQFIRIDGRWKLLATSNQLDRPFLFDLLGDARNASGWLKWSAGRELTVPQEAWNTGTGITGATYEHANCAFLVDRRSLDGHYYLLYEDAPEKVGFGGEGHGNLFDCEEHRPRALDRSAGLIALAHGAGRGFHGCHTKAPEQGVGRRDGCARATRWPVAQPRHLPPRDIRGALSIRTPGLHRPVRVPRRRAPRGRQRRLAHPERRVRGTSCRVAT